MSVENKIEKIEDHLDSISKDVAEINITMAKNTALLDEHIRRTNLLEEAIKPIQEHVFHIRGFIKISLFILGTSAAILGILHQLGIL